MLTHRTSALERELAARNPVPSQAPGNAGNAAHSPEATALLRHIFELADAAGPDRPPSHPVHPSHGQLPHRPAHSVRRVAAALAAGAVAAGGVCAAVLSAGHAAVPHRTTTAWLASRALPEPRRLQRVQSSPAPSSPGSSWQLASAIVPSGWRLGTPGPGPGTVTCPTTTVCYITGDTARTASGPATLGGLYVSTDGARSWSVVALPQGFSFTSDLACTTALVCAAGGTEHGTAVFAETRDGGHRWTVTTTGIAGGIVHLACVSPSRCMALSVPPATAAALSTGTPAARPSGEHFVRTTDAGATWHVTALPAAVELTSLQCPTASDCVTVGFPARTTGATPQGTVLWTDDAGARWQHGSLPSGAGFTSMAALSCGSPARCMAVASVAVPNPSPCSVVLGGLRQATRGTVTTPTSRTCMSGATTQVSTTLTTGDGGASWQLAPLPPSVPEPKLDAVACAGARACWTAGSQAVRRGTAQGSSVLLGTANGGRAWRVATAVVPAGAPNDQGGDAYLSVGSISCPSTTVCVALGATDQGSRFAPVYRLGTVP